MKVTLFIGTRPEAIKLCPVVRALREHGAFETRVCVTGQHREMLAPVLEVFDVAPDSDLALMQPGQTLPDLTARSIVAITRYLQEERPEWVLVQGDTTSVFCAALCANYQQLRVGHVEAGLRTGQRYAPFPEEINRVLTSHLTDLHFAPTEAARNNLLREGIDAQRVYVTGNTVIDALQVAVARARQRAPHIAQLPEELQPGRAGGPLVLITGHRRENFGAGLEAICGAVRTLARAHAHAAFVYPVHLNPQVQAPVRRLLGDVANVHLIDPLGYLEFVALMDRSTLILTDSGGVQEEAPSLGKPVLVMRDVTERPEGIAAGVVRLVGTDEARIVEEVGKLLVDEAARNAMAQAVNPYGDGRAAGRIAAALATHAGGRRSADSLRLAT